jgi:hypothetical protein
MEVMHEKNKFNHFSLFWRKIYETKIEESIFDENISSIDFFNVKTNKVIVEEKLFFIDLKSILYAIRTKSK